jgi:methylmalonyl-CoA/ethylmalonyl-CoA epimerase
MKPKPEPFAMQGYQTLIFDHIGIVTNDVNRAAIVLGNSVGANGFTRRFDDEVLGVSVRFVRDLSGIVYELIAPLGDKSLDARTLASKANLLNQIAYRTRSISDVLPKLRECGHLPLGPARPAKAFDGANVQFLINEFGYIVELIENPDHVHVFYDAIT